MSKLIMLIGLQGSGKSTYAEKIATENYAIICSSDRMRKELYGSESDQSHNNELFDNLHKKIRDLLMKGYNVICDATNVNSKQRIAFLQSIKKYNCETEAVIVATPYYQCILNNNKRERKVPEYAIKRTYMNFCIPMKNEGWNKISIVYPKDFEFLNHLHVVYNMKELPHDNPNHSATIGDHMLLSYQYLIEHYPNCSERLKIATLIHDIGKPFTKVFMNGKGEKTDIAHYYNHHKVGAYDCLFLNIPEELKLDIAILIQYHMEYFVSWRQSEKSQKRDRALMGEELFSELTILHECDKNSH